ncbi:MAG TPA: hypothetical protein VMZ74_15710 [Ramlibacter sp.]|nr:hypothetical protein [Ramlibacter sp.]
MKRTILTPTFAWLAAAGVALALALAGPDESNVMGRLPSFTAKRLDQQSLVLPGQLQAERTLALVAYTRHQREEVQSWIQGLDLQANSPIPWFRLSVVNDPGSDVARSEVEKKILARYPNASERARLVPVFTNREAFARAAGTSSIDHAAVLVIDRDGHVLARAEGPYDAAKAQALRETLLGRQD